MSMTMKQPVRPAPALHVDTQIKGHTGEVELPVADIKGSKAKHANHLDVDFTIEEYQKMDWWVSAFIWITSSHFIAY